MRDPEFTKCTMDSFLNKPNAPAPTKPEPIAGEPGTVIETRDHLDRIVASMINHAELLEEDCKDGSAQVLRNDAKAINRTICQLKGWDEG